MPRCPAGLEKAGSRSTMMIRPMSFNIVGNALAGEPRSGSDLRVVPMVMISNLLNVCQSVSKCDNCEEVATHEVSASPNLCSRCFM